jgi:thymidylate synthase (FAD)
MAAAKLISFTKPHDIDFADNIKDVQELVAFCARVSNPQNQNNTQTSEKLLQYMIKNQHWSPFEMVNVCIEITTTRDIARQILRHRSFSFQEFSQRYADVTDASSGLEFEIRDCRMQDPKNRQNSISVDQDDIEAKYLEHQWIKLQREIIAFIDDKYRWALEQGMAKECARVILPEGLTQSRLYMNGTLRSWLHYIELRTANGTQLEHQRVARTCAAKIVEIFPMLATHWADSLPSWYVPGDTTTAITSTGDVTPLADSVITSKDVENGITLTNTVNYK